MTHRGQTGGNSEGERYCRGLDELVQRKQERQVEVGVMLLRVRSLDDTGMYVGYAGGYSS